MKGPKTTWLWGLNKERWENMDRITWREKSKNLNQVKKPRRTVKAVYKKFCLLQKAKSAISMIRNIKFLSFWEIEQAKVPIIWFLTKSTSMAGVTGMNIYKASEAEVILNT